MEKILASEGMYLTQKSVENEGARVFAISLYLADNDSKENWREATKEEYYEWQRKQDTEVEEQQARAQEDKPSPQPSPEGEGGYAPVETGAHEEGEDGGVETPSHEEN